MYSFLSETNRKIIEAIVGKAEKACPGALALIAVYGSAATGDLHEKSDLDLMILINDESARVLSECFILEDKDIGYDLYCTTWEMLENDASCQDAHLSKLMDSKVLYTADKKAVLRLLMLQEKVKATLASEERFEKAKKAFDQAKIAFCDSFISDTLAQVRSAASDVLYYLLNAVMFYHGRYFKKGIKRTFEELQELELPFDLKEEILRVITSTSIDEIQQALRILMQDTRKMFENREKPEKTPAPENLRGTYEEMYSNWHGKMHEASIRGDVYSSFANLASLQSMIKDVSAYCGTADISFMDRFDPVNLTKNEEVFDQVLQEYLKEYEKIGLKPKKYKDADDFLTAYTG